LKREKERSKQVRPPSLHFKCIDSREHIWSLRISHGYRALGIFEGEVVTWFWVGDHKAYEKYF
ncbi:MAG: hypothetical protein DRG63_02470, partial [Deltaproteobacteria bacterium]